MDLEKMRIELIDSDNRIKELQRETLSCACLSLAGKIEICDKKRLAQIHEEIKNIEATMKGNLKILVDLERILSENTFESVLQLRNRVVSASDLIRRHKIELNRFSQKYLKQYPDAIDSVHEREEVKAFKAKIATAEAKRDNLGKLLSKVESILSKFEASEEAEMDFRQPARIRTLRSNIAAN